MYVSNMTAEDMGLSETAYKRIVKTYRDVKTFCAGRPHSTSEYFDFVQKGADSPLYPFWARPNGRLEYISPGDVLKAEDLVGIIRPQLMAFTDTAVNAEIMISVDGWDKTLFLYPVPNGTNAEMWDWLEEYFTPLDFRHIYKTTEESVRFVFPDLPDSTVATVSLHILCTNANCGVKFSSEPSEDSQYILLSVQKGNHVGYLFDEFHDKGLHPDTWYEDVFYTRYRHMVLESERYTVGVYAYAPDRMVVVVGSENRSYIHITSEREFHTTPHRFVGFGPKRRIVVGRRDSLWMDQKVQNPYSQNAVTIGDFEIVYTPGGDDANCVLDPREDQGHAPSVNLNIREGRRPLPDPQESHYETQTPEPPKQSSFEIPETHWTGGEPSVIATHHSSSEESDE